MGWLTETWTQWWFTPNEVKMQEIPQPIYRIRDLGDKNLEVVYHLTHFSFFFFSLSLNCMYLFWLCCVYFAEWTFLCLWEAGSNLQLRVGFSSTWFLFLWRQALQCMVFRSCGAHPCPPPRPPSGSTAQAEWLWCKGFAAPQHVRSCKMK